MTLFAEVVSENEAFVEVLRKYYREQRDSASEIDSASSGGRAAGRTTFEDGAVVLAVPTRPKLIVLEVCISLRERTTNPRQSALKGRSDDRRCLADCRRGRDTLIAWTAMLNCTFAVSFLTG